VKADTGFPKN